MKHVLKKPSKCPYFKKLFWGMIKHDDLQQNVEITECIKQLKIA